MDPGQTQEHILIGSDEEEASAAKRTRQQGGQSTRQTAGSLNVAFRAAVASGFTLLWDTCASVSVTPGERADSDTSWDDDGGLKFISASASPIQGGWQGPRGPSLRVDRAWNFESVDDSDSCGNCACDSPVWRPASPSQAQSEPISPFRRGGAVSELFSLSNCVSTHVTNRTGRWDYPAVQLRPTVTHICTGL